MERKMATHFARGTLTEGLQVSSRLSSSCHNEARKLPEHRRTRFLASRALLAELLFMLYGTSELPKVITEPEGRPVFADPELPRFSIAYAGNIVGLALTTEGDCGLDMERFVPRMDPMPMTSTRSRATRTYGCVTRTIPTKPERS